MTSPHSNWRETLAAGDIVAFRYPCPDEPAAEKTRPCLVLEVDHAAGCAVLVYGTSRWRRPDRGRELRIADPAACAAAALDRPTRFVGSRRCTASLSSGRFEENAAGTAILGRLDTADRIQLDRLAQELTSPPRRPGGRRRGYLRRPARTGRAHDQLDRSLP